MDAVRASDHDRYLSALYAPADKRDALFSLYAFNAEIASVRDRIHEPLPGEVRLQWWRDVIAAENDAETGHPIADALRATISANRLPKTAFDNMLEARIFDLYDDPMPSRTDLEGYCGETAAALIQLAAMMLDPQEAPRFADLAGRAGCAQAITGLLLLLPLYRRRGQCFVPADILAAAGSSSEEFVKGEGGPGAQRAVAAMIALARDHLGAFERGAPALPASLRPAFLPLALTRAYLGRMEKTEQSPRGGAAKLSTLRKHWLLLRHASRGWTPL
ncbi:MAG: phytoene/squalene synthase family protein [Mesorhizobium sp.]|uniref:phytoene/squalene synthase family protein n=1 Tax=unclassified Mesorhizobium TaxID=325217 RepID=UPI000F75079A|nr:MULTISPECIES: phytoene/squalene synthase family protein [unclassified Mesorhizobium]AZO46719.1 phytoene/squalene synthase family protein [Mesorhizobium sp. M4B.F.Ca.ET.058.02.1.1]RUX46197.1 phytoene/squalene synthase family protein [Mesorhizobium sp. M4A.F.Ca.ET.050.02.1.1]RVC39918.1 phytoene/squalene synthase family protein [Mesorhizobium sp. M4A.F.Ca.ET.090.04.2.1]RWC22046.1 MAG: phytoene/squalene synthase family protein [Mesorhizobium sp.]RWC51917.1 MAG: phytoene/squalene synthase family